MLLTTAVKPVFHGESQEWTYGSYNDWSKARILAPQACYASMWKPGACIYTVSIAPNPDHPHVTAMQEDAGIAEKASILSKYDKLKEVFSKTRV